MRWDAARAASQRPTRKYKPVGPVGDPTNHNAPECFGCRMHVCSCPKLEPCGLNTVTMDNPHYRREERIAALAPKEREAAKHLLLLLLTGEWSEELL